MDLNLARSWWVLLLRGILAICVGVVAFFWPGSFLEVLVMFFGGYMLVDGVIALGAVFSGQGPGDRMLALALEAVLGILIGVVVFLVPAEAAVGLVYLVAAWAILTGFLEIFAAVRLRRVIRGEFWLILSGVVSVALGVALAINPLAGVVVIGWTLGAYAVMFGVLMIGLGLRLRSHYRPPSGYPSV